MSQSQVATTFPLKLTAAQRIVVAEFVPGLVDRLKLDEAGQRTIRLSRLELEQIHERAVSSQLRKTAGRNRVSLRHIVDLSSKAIEQAEDSGSIPAAERRFQFTITLRDSRPRIWRRIQVNNVSLDKLHEYIQTAMGWTNSHLHHFHVGTHRYGDPMLLDESFSEMGYRDSTRTKLGAILPRNGSRFRFEYEYDFGDSWNHEIVFEGCIRADPGVRYPLCLEGERACPPEDVGGVSGYRGFLDALADPRDERHQEFRKWIGGEFDANAFDPVVSTKRMQRGLPDWRRMAGERWM